MLVRTDVVRGLGGFDEHLFQLTDWDLWIRLSQAGRAAACSEVLVGCIEHRRSMLLTSEPDVFEEFDYVDEKHRAAREVADVPIDRRLFTRWVALGHRRAGAPPASTLSATLRNRDTAASRALVAPLGERPVEWVRACVRLLQPTATACSASRRGWLYR